MLDGRGLRRGRVSQVWAWPHDRQVRRQQRRRGHQSVRDRDVVSRGAGSAAAATHHHGPGTGGWVQGVHQEFDHLPNIQEEQRPTRPQPLDLPSSGRRSLASSSSSTSPRTRRTPQRRSTSRWARLIRNTSQQIVTAASRRPRSRRLRRPAVNAMTELPSLNLAGTFLLHTVLSPEIYVCKT